ncbi:MAG TPA: S49 family peptidase [Pirellulaceae bacterium]
MESEFILAPRFKVDVPNLSEYFGVWAMHDQTFRGLVDRFNGINLHAHISSASARDSVAAQNSADYQITSDGIAIINITGPMMKSVSSMSGGTSMVRTRQQLRSARNNPVVAGAMLVMDTPGGTVRGNSDLADEVAAFAATKPIFAFTEDMTASGGVSVASQATKRFANSSTALYGAMGVYTVITDESGSAEQLGVKVHVVRAGEFKGIGESGTKITEAQLAEFQRLVNAQYAGYTMLIAQGLKKPVEMIRSLADGRVHTAADAVEMGLIDGVQSFDRSYQQLVSLTQKPSSNKPTQTRSTSTMEKIPASLTDLKTSFPKSTAEWRETQLERDASLQESAIAYGQHVEAQAEQAAEKHKAELAAAQKKSDDQAKNDKAAKSGKLGHQPLRFAGAIREAQEALEDGYQGATGDPVEDFNAAVAKLSGPNADLKRRQSAIRTVAKRNPELYQAYLLETNTGSRQQRMIKEKLESSVSSN